MINYCHFIYSKDEKFYLRPYFYYFELIEVNRRLMGTRGRVCQILSSLQQGRVIENPERNLLNSYNKCFLFLKEIKDLIIL
jgi:hypothetical protein